MDGFSAIPSEIVRHIAVEAVKVRGYKRAVRLRLVNRSWNREVTEAIIESGILDSVVNSEESSFGPKYLMHKLRRKQWLLSRPLRILRLVAERVVAFRSSDTNSPDQEAIEEYLWEICRLSFRCNRGAPYRRLWYMEPNRMDPIHDSDDDFKQALLAAASSTNNVAFVLKLLPSVQGRPDLIFRTNEDCPIIGWPLDVAAYMGHVEVVRMLLGAIKDAGPTCLEEAHNEIVWVAGRADQMNTLELGLDPAYEWHDPTLFKVLLNTRSIAIFDRLFPLCKGQLIEDRVESFQPQPDQNQLRLDFLSRVFSLAAVRGELAMMKHFAQLGAKHIDWEDNEYGHNGYRALITQVAAGGHADVIAYLLENGTKVSSRSLEAACRSGNAKCVRILLENGATDIDGFKPGRALMESVKRENEVVLRLLLESGISIDKDQRQQALDAAEEAGLTSMIRVLNEYQ